jgi:hypothetical protein
VMRLDDRTKTCIENALQRSIVRKAKLLDRPKLKRFWIRTKCPKEQTYLVYQIEDAQGIALYIVPEGGRLSSDYTKSASL